MVAGYCAGALLHVAKSIRYIGDDSEFNHGKTDYGLDAAVEFGDFWSCYVGVGDLAL